MTKRFKCQQDESMADAAAFLTGLPAMFLATLQCFELVQSGRHFESDFGNCFVRLKAAQIRLARWGATVGIDPKASDSISAFAQLVDPNEAEGAIELLQKIQNAFAGTEDLAASFVSLHTTPSKVTDEVEGNILNVIDQETELKKMNRGLRDLTLDLDQVGKDMYLSFKLAKDKAKDKAAWALYKKKHFEDLLKNVSGLVKELEDLFPKAHAQETLCKREIAPLQSENLQLLHAAINLESESSDTILLQALKTQAAKRGMTFEDNTFKGESRVDAGNRYAAGEAREGDDHVFRRTVIEGRAIVRLGNRYDGPTATRKQSYGEDSP